MNNQNNNQQGFAQSSAGTPLMNYGELPEGHVQQDDITREYGTGQPALANTAQDPYLSGEYDPYEEPVQEGGVLEGGLPSLNNSQLPDNRRLS